MNTQNFIILAALLAIVPPLMVIAHQKLREWVLGLWYRAPCSTEARGSVIELSKNNEVETETLNIIDQMEKNSYVSNWQAERLLLALFTADNKNKALVNLQRIDMHVKKLNPSEQKWLKRLSILIKNSSAKNLHILADISRHSH